MMVPDRSGKVLILRRHNISHGGGEWCPPGGKVDYGETVEAALVKELREETALTATATRFLFYQDSPPFYPGGMHCLNLYFECAATGAIALNEESSDYLWIGPSDLAACKLAFRNDLGLLRYWKEKQGG